MASPPGTDLFLQLPSGRVRTRSHGTEDAPLVLGAPGLSANSFTFNALGPALAKAGHRLVAMDLRGRGRSDRGPAGSYGWANHARDVVATADALGAGRFDFVGHSMGAFVGLALMNLAPARVRRLVLIDALGVPHESAMPPIRAAAQRLGTVYPSSETFIDAVKTAGVVPWSAFWEDHYREDLVEHDGGARQRAAPEAILEDLAYAAATDVRALWPAVTVPTLVVRAGKPFAPGADIITPEDLAAFQATVPSARAVDVPANHYGVMNHPLTVQAVEEHLR